MQDLRTGDHRDDHEAARDSSGIDGGGERDMADSAHSTALNTPLAKAALDAKKAAADAAAKAHTPDSDVRSAPAPMPSYVQPANDPRAGILWMIGACAFFSAFGALARYISIAGVHPLQTMFLRLLAATLFLAPLYFVRGPSFFRSSSLKLYAIRSVIGFLSMVSWFYAIRTMPIAELTAIQFLAPIFATVGAVVFLGETVRLRRWTATLIAFAGALIIVRPGHMPFSTGIALALFSTMAAGFTSILVKQLTHHDDPDKVVFLTNALMLPFAVVPALLVWQWPSFHMWLLIVLLGAVGTIGHLMLVRAFSVADASLVMSLDFSKLPFAVAFGYLMFGELATIWTWIGATIIFASGLYIVHREAEVKRRMPVQKPAAAA